ncbi:hypothetical protein C2G38_2173248 [Gigaspora rosea]|uniref:Uncharacterized protein n=1 Tax=Gigaspora rosea TaxID=44941 RepID=A0A397VJS9_9GLOM|nr:hypothetical protein C2G38_2173248 [Gigaspora rosea]
MDPLGGLFWRTFVVGGLFQVNFHGLLSVDFFGGLFLVDFLLWYSCRYWNHHWSRRWSRCAIFEVVETFVTGDLAPLNFLGGLLSMDPFGIVVVTGNVVGVVVGVAV